MYRRIVLAGLSVGVVLFLAVACVPERTATKASVTPSTEAVKPEAAVPHLASTPQEMRAEIDYALELILDPWAGAAANRAAARLDKIGAPAVPALLAGMASLDFVDAGARCAMPTLTQTLHDVVNSESGSGVPITYICRVGMLGNEAHEIVNCERCRKLWLQWWNSPLGRALAAQAEATTNSAK